MATPVRTASFSADAGSDEAADWRSTLGRVGIAARGVLYLVLGFLALQFALGQAGSDQVSDRGAIQFVQQQPFGTVLLWLLALGLTALALWQLVTAFTGDPVEGSSASDRAKFALKGLLYGATAATAFAALGVAGSSSGGGGGGGGQEQATAMVLGLPYGQWVVGAVGLGVIAYAVRTVLRQTRDARFMQRLATDEMERSTWEGVRSAGRWGYGARGVVIGITGGFLVVAALQHSPDSTRGLAGALAVLSRQAFGSWLLGAVALGLAAYGVFSLVEARHRRAA